MSSGKNPWIDEALLRLYLLCRTLGDDVGKHRTWIEVSSRRIFFEKVQDILLGAVLMEDGKLGSLHRHRVELGGFLGRGFHGKGVAILEQFLVHLDEAPLFFGKGGGIDRQKILRPPHDVLKKVVAVFEVEGCILQGI